MDLRFTSYIKSNRGYGQLITESQWSRIRDQLTRDELARLNRGEAIEYQGNEIRKTKGQPTK